MTVLEQLAGDRAPDAARAGDGDAHQDSSGPAAEDALDALGVRVAHEHVDEVAVLDHRVLVGQEPLAEPGEERDPGLAVFSRQR